MSEAMVPPALRAAYFEAAEWLLDVIDQDGVAAVWNEPSAVARYTVGGLVAHAVHAGLLRLESLLAEPPPSALRRVPVAEFFGPNKVDHLGDDDPLFAFLRSSAEEAASHGPVGVRADGRGCRIRLGTVLPLTPAQRPMALARVPDGHAPLAEYLGTRVLELIVHGDDIVASVPGLSVTDPPSASVEWCLTLCLELARAQAGDLGVLRAFTRAERAQPDVLRVL